MHTTKIRVPLGQDPAELLDIYLSLSVAEREGRFVGTTIAAERVGLSRRTIESWVDEGHIRAIRVGKKYQVDLESLRDYILRCAMR